MYDIIKILKENQDEKYRDFQSSLLPNLKKQVIIGVRTPALRNIAKDLIKEKSYSDFLTKLPHFYFEENQIHAFIISQLKDFNDCIKLMDKFLPYIDNWATCDQTSPKIFKSHKTQLLVYINKWLKSDHSYTVRFAIGMLMRHFLDEDFKSQYVETVCSIKSKDYYVNMEIAWYLATALSKQWEKTIPFITKAYLDTWTLKKTIQKAKESRRISSEQKLYLKSLKDL